MPTALSPVGSCVPAALSCAMLSCVACMCQEEASGTAGVARVRMSREGRRRSELASDTHAAAVGGMAPVDVIEVPASVEVGMSLVLRTLCCREPPPHHSLLYCCFTVSDSQGVGPSR